MMRKHQRKLSHETLFSFEGTTLKLCSLKTGYHCFISNAENTAYLYEFLKEIRIANRSSNRSRLSYKGRTVDALALGADEGRD